MNNTRKRMKAAIGIAKREALEAWRNMDNNRDEFGDPDWQCENWWLECVAKVHRLQREYWNRWCKFKTPHNMENMWS